MAKGKPRKPSGVNGPVKLSAGPKGTSSEFLQLEFPETKEGIEQFMLRGFLDAAEKSGLLDYCVTRCELNPTDDFDFSLETSKGRRYLELMEIAPLHRVGGGYDKAPSSYRGYDFAREIVDHVHKKSKRYSGSEGQGIILLLYFTDWKFMPSETVMALTQFWLLKEEHCFEEIYSYFPVAAGEGFARLIYPTPPDFWNDFDPEQYRQNVTHNLNPQGWESGAE